MVNVNGNLTLQRGEELFVTPTDFSETHLV